MQLFKCKNDSSNYKTNVGLNIGTKVGIVLWIVSEDIEVNVVGNVKIEAQICVILIEMEIFNNKA
jgi:hypothetical protein